MIDAFLAEKIATKSISSISENVPTFSDMRNDTGNFPTKGISDNIPDFSKATTDTIHISTRNESLDGNVHPETSIPFKSKEVATSTGEKVEGVFPVFESYFDAQLPDELLTSTDSVQFKESNKQLNEWISNNPEEAKIKFSAEDLEDIRDGYTPEGYTWHHSEEKGKMQLVDTEDHAKTAHTGGKVIWGGGSENR